MFKSCEGGGPPKPTGSPSPVPAQPMNPGRRLLSDGLALEPLDAAQVVLVKTSKGELRGLRSSSRLHFRGVPYAAPLVGARRFQPPVKVEPWASVLDCTRFGPAVPQSPDVCTVAMMNGSDLSERTNYGHFGDGCLNLNVSTPAAHAGGPLPVLVWIHGGGQKYGSNAESGIFCPESALACQPVVTVSLNYRLQTMGFLHLPKQGSTNRAIRDIIQGLEWVRDEIACFGGDPTNVTVYGESAGAINIIGLLATPLAKGLFSRAILSSGAVNDISTANWDIAKESLYNCLRKIDGIEFDAASGEPTIESLGKVPYEKLLGLKPKDPLQSQYGLAAAAPTWVFRSGDGDPIFPVSIMEAIEAGNAAGVPLIVGQNYNEWVAMFQGLAKGKGVPGLLTDMLFSSLVYRGVGPYNPLPMIRRAIAQRNDHPGCSNQDLQPLLDQIRASLADGPGVDASAPDERGSFRKWLAIQETDAGPRLVQTLMGATQDMVAAAQSQHADVFSYLLQLTPEECSKGNMHGIDLPLFFYPDDQAGYSDGERVYISKAFFDRDTPGPQLQGIMCGLKDCVVRFMQTGTPGFFAAGPDDQQQRLAWPPLRNTLEDTKSHSESGSGCLRMGSRPTFDAWAGAASPEVELLREKRKQLRNK